MKNKIENVELIGLWQNVKVCFLSFEYPPKIIGGAGTYAGYLVKGLKDRGIDVCTITSARGDKTVPITGGDQKTYRIPTVDIPYWRRLFFANPAISLLYDLNRLWKFDLVHFNEPHLITRSVNLPTVCTIHSTQVDYLKQVLEGIRSIKTKENIVDLILKCPVGGLCDIITARASDRIICPSYNLVRQLKSYCFFDEQKIHVIPNGIDVKKFDEINCDAGILNKYAIEKEDFLLYLGRLSSSKGVEYLIQAFKGIKKECTNLKLVIAGSGSFEPYLRNLAHGVRDILFIGFVDSLVVKKALYENCLAVVVPSLYEALPMVVLEAMTCGKPVIASSVGDVPSMIKHGKNGFLVKPSDSKSLEKFVRILYETPSLRQEMGSYGRKLVEEEYSIDRMVSETLKVYDLLLSESAT